MLEFLNEDIRTRFHLLPIDEQMSLQDIADRCFSYGKVVTILFVDVEPGSSETSIRINKKFNLSQISDNVQV